MKLGGFRKDYHWFSKKTSDVARQLAFAGIAIVWIFRIPKELKVPEGLLLPTALLALALAFDLFHYITSTLIWGHFHRYHEKRLKNIDDDPELTARPWYNYPANTFFTLKVACVVFAYVLIIAYIWEMWSGSA